MLLPVVDGTTRMSRGSSPIRLRPKVGMSLISHDYRVIKPTSLHLYATIPTTFSSSPIMHRVLLIAAGATLAASASQNTVGPTHGVPPSLLSSYTPSTSSGNKTWKCLTSGETIAWSAVNDDYCDCSDGSDEPGM
jgi:hypothetical protein